MSPYRSVAEKRRLSSSARSGGSRRRFSPVSGQEAKATSHTARPGGTSRVDVLEKDQAGGGRARWTVVERDSAIARSLKEGTGDAVGRAASARASGDSDSRTDVSASMQASHETGSSSESCECQAPAVMPTRAATTSIPPGISRQRAVRIRTPSRFPGSYQVTLVCSGGQPTARARVRGAHLRRTDQPVARAPRSSDVSCDGS